MKDIKLYHGSRGGIEGDIEPCSRLHCGFGKGFYMGTDKQQAKSLVCNEHAPVFYLVEFKLSEIPEDRILTLEGKDWLNAILAARALNENYSKLDIAKKWLKKLDRYDVIIGKIADDKMVEAVQDFANNRITDAALLKCLQAVDLGTQYVAKTPFACSKIEILREQTLHSKEKQDAQAQSMFYRRVAGNSIGEAVKQTRGQGQFIDDIIKAEKMKMRKNKQEGR